MERLSQNMDATMLTCNHVNIAEEEESSDSHDTLDLKSSNSLPNE